MLVKAKSPLNYNADSEPERSPAGTKRNNHCQLLQCSEQLRQTIKGSLAVLTIDFNGSRSASSTTKGDQISAAEGCISNRSEGAVSVLSLWGVSAERVNKSKGQTLLRGTQSQDALSQTAHTKLNLFGFSVLTDRHNPHIWAWGAAQEGHLRSALLRLYVWCVPGWVSR